MADIIAINQQWTPAAGRRARQRSRSALHLLKAIDADQHDCDRSDDELEALSIEVAAQALANVDDLRERSGLPRRDLMWDLQRKVGRPIAIERGRRAS